MGLSIILRTVCGCEQFITIPHRHYPDEWRVPFTRNHGRVFAFPDENAPPTASASHTRTFRRTPTASLYGYPVYLEVA